MPRNGSGTYALPAGQPVSTATVIDSSVHNTLATDLASALTASIAKDGQTTATANLPMGTFKHTGVGDATARTQYASAAQVCDNSLTILASVAGTNTITATLSPAITAYAAGQKFHFIPANNNSGAATIAINGLSAKAIVKGSASTALASGDLVTTCYAAIIYDGTSFVLLNPATNDTKFAVLASTNTFTGATQTISAAQPYLRFIETDAAANNQRWALEAQGESFIGLASNDAESVNTAWLEVTRTGATVDGIALGSTALTWNGNTLFSTANDGAGSGLDADLLDGVQSTGYAARSTDTFTGTLTGYASGPTGTIIRVIVDGMCTLSIQGGSAITGTSNATALTMTGVPVGARPLIARDVPCFITDGGALMAGIASVGTGGTITFYLLVDQAGRTGTSASSFTASGTKALPGGWHITYPLY